MPKITVINFSGRADGNCSAIADSVVDCHAEADIRRYDFSALSVNACGKCGYECFDRRENCPFISDPVFSMYERITVSDLAYFIVPDYCDRPNAYYYIFDERSQCFFQQHADLLDKYLAVRKRFIVVSNTGTENFIGAFRYQIADGEVPNVLFLSAKKFGRVSIVGDLLSSPEAVKEVRCFCER